MVLHSMLKHVLLMSTFEGTGLQQQLPQSVPHALPGGQQVPVATQPSGVQPAGTQPSGVQPSGLLPTPAVTEAAARPIMASAVRNLIRIAPSVRVRGMNEGAMPMRVSMATDRE